MKPVLREVNVLALEADREPVGGEGEEEPGQPARPELGGGGSPADGLHELARGQGRDGPRHEETRDEDPALDAQGAVGSPHSLAPLEELVKEVTAGTRARRR